MNNILTEKYRPEFIKDVKSHTQIKQVMNHFLLKKNFPNMLFYGPSGVGKTTLILAIAKEYYGDSYQDCVLELNASDERGINVVRNKIKTLSQFITKKFPYKMIILDEVDSMTNDSQAALRMIMENHHKNTRFCLICNNINKIIKPVISRCSLFYFKKIQSNIIFSCLKNIASKENMEVTDDDINHTIDKSDGDLRKCINFLDLGLFEQNKFCVDKIIDFVKNNNKIDIYKYCQNLYYNNCDGLNLIVKMNDYFVNNNDDKFVELLIDTYSSLKKGSNILFQLYDLFLKIKSKYNS